MKVSGIFISNPDRVLYAEQGITKYALAAYYDAIGPLIVPHVAKRPLVLVRCPQGRNQKCFYQKHWTTEAPGVDAVDIREESGKVMPYAMVHNATGPVALVQHGVLEMHVRGSRSDDLEAPDRIVFDLDPSPEVPWRRVIEAAAWSTRVRPNAPVSVPVAWDEIEQLRGSDQYTVSNVPYLLTSRWWNPWAELPKTRQSLTRRMIEAVSSRRAPGGDPDPVFERHRFP